MHGYRGYRTLLLCLVFVGVIALTSPAQEVTMTKPQVAAPAARICQWYGGKQAALSFRFDDSHPTQIQNALPLLNEYGCIVTFLVNPGNPGYQDNRAVWEGPLLAAGHEILGGTVTGSGPESGRIMRSCMRAPRRSINN